MILEWLGLSLVVLALAGCALLIFVVLGLADLLRTYLALRREGLALEERRISTPLPADHALPHVVVQLPSYNEGPIIERAVAGATRLDWPRDRLHVQVCDDSTDSTTDHARTAADRARAMGFDVVVLHRGERRDFKAGALNAARERTEHEYFALLDVDYLAKPDFLRRCMAVLLAEPRLAFVQARPDFLNAGENALTRAQAILLDFHYGLEQPTRSWSGQALPFNGTCGIWRRAAIEAGGGWHGDMMTEDWDLSYRALLAGWRGVFVTSVSVPGELPARMSDWTTQQRRWAAGIGEVAWRMVPTLLARGDLSAGERWRALAPLLTWFGYAAFAATFLLALSALALAPSFAVPVGAAAYAVFAAVTVILFALMLTANRFLHPSAPIRSFVADFPVALMLCAYFSWACLLSVPATMVGRRRAFERTPKQGIAGSSG